MADFRNKRSVILGVLGLGLAFAGSVQAHPTRRLQRPQLAQAFAQTPPREASELEILVIEGSNAEGGIDEALRSISELTRPPFSAYSRIALVSRRRVPITANPSDLSLPGGNRAVVTPGARREDGKYNVTVQLTINGRAHNMQFAATQGSPFFTARSTGPNSALILGFVLH